MRFQDKIAIVTGGGSGMGKEVATRFVAEGGSVVVNGRDAAKTEAAAHQIDPSGQAMLSRMSATSPFRRPVEALVKTLQSIEIRPSRCVVQQCRYLCAEAVPRGD